MSRYALRNQSKIAYKLGEKFLIRLIASLDWAFRNDNFELREFEKPHTLIIIDDQHNSSGKIVFHVIKKTFDVYNLAYKEII